MDRAAAKVIRMKKFVIYTVMAGVYGDVHQPLCVDERFDYILFSNNFEDCNIGVWQVRRIPQPEEIAMGDNKRLSRYPKTHPETLLGEYEASLYVDANIQIADQWVYNRFVQLYEQNIEYAGIKLLLTGRDCVYRHSYDICMMRAEHDYNAIVEMHEMYTLGYPENQGINENGVIFRSHTERMKNADELWWNWIVNYSYRDQFSYMYCLWKYSVPIRYFLPDGEDVRNTAHFSYIPHNDLNQVAKKKWIKVGLLEKWRNKCRRRHYDRYCEHWVTLCKMPFPKVWLFLWGLIVLCVNLPEIIIQKIWSKP